MVGCVRDVVSAFMSGDSCFIAIRGSGKLVPDCDCVLAIFILPVAELPDVGKISSSDSCLEFGKRDGIEGCAWTNNCSLSLDFLTMFDSSTDDVSGIGSDWVGNTDDLDCEVVLCEVTKTGALAVGDPSSNGFCTFAMAVVGGTDSSFGLATSLDGVGFVGIPLEATSPFELGFVPWEFRITKRHRARINNAITTLKGRLFLLVG